MCRLQRRRHGSKQRLTELKDPKLTGSSLTRDVGTLLLQRSLENLKKRPLLNMEVLGFNLSHEMGCTKLWVVFLNTSRQLPRKSPRFQSPSSRYTEDEKLHGLHGTLGRQYTVPINVTMRRHRETNVAVEKQFWVCVCNLSYRTCKAYALYCHLWPVILSL